MNKKSILFCSGAILLLFFIIGSASASSDLSDSDTVIIGPKNTTVNLVITNITVDDNDLKRAKYNNNYGDYYLDCKNNVSVKSIKQDITYYKLAKVKVVSYKKVPVYKYKTVANKVAIKKCKAYTSSGKYLFSVKTYKKSLTISSAVDIRVKAWKKGYTGDIYLKQCYKTTYKKVKYLAYYKKVKTYKYQTKITKKVTKQVTCKLSKAQIYFYEKNRTTVRVARVSYNPPVISGWNIKVSADYSFDKPYSIIYEYYA